MWDDARPYRDLHHIIDSRWTVMEVGTLAVGTAVLFFYRLPFIVMPLAVTLWYMSMDFAPLLLNGNDVDWKARKLVSVAFGLGMLAVAVYVDVRTRRRPDYGFWLYFFGMLASGGALSLMDSGSQLGEAMYSLLNAAFVFIGALLSRRVFTIFGGLGVARYLGHLSYNVFKNSPMFPVVLTASGLGLVAGGIWWQRNESGIRSSFRSLLPSGLRSALESAES